MKQKFPSVNTDNKNDKIRVYPAQMGTQSFGSLQVRCTTTSLIPIENATVNITFPGEPNNILEQLTTDSSGLTETIELPAPPIDYSMEPTTEQPFSQYDIHVGA